MAAPDKVFCPREGLLDPAEGGQGSSLRQPRLAQAVKTVLTGAEDPTDQIVGIDNATRIFSAAKHPKSFVSLADADHLLRRRTDALYVASVIAGRGPHVLGVNPGSDVRVYQTTGLCSDTAAAIRQSVRDGAKVVSMSYGFAGPGICLTHEVATSYAAAFAVVVAAAGNERAQPWMQPANDLHVLTVAALNAFDQPTGFTHQSTSTDIAAPGEGIIVHTIDCGELVGSLQHGVHVARARSDYAVPADARQ